MVGVDNPRPPPCVRCRRESKRCEFSATRRKRKPSDAIEQDVDGPLRRDKRMMVGEATYNSPPSDGSPYPLQPSSSLSIDKEGWSESSSDPSQLPRPRPSPQYASNDALSTEQFQSSVTARPGTRYAGSVRASGPSYKLESSQHVMNKTAAELLSPAITNSHDALHLLSEAAGRTEDLNRQCFDNRYAGGQSASPFANPLSPITQAGTPRTGRQSFPRQSRSGPIDGYYQVNGSGPTDPQVSDITDIRSADLQDPGYIDAVKAWSRLRFVRAGWLTVEEAMAYIA
jgi:hypothetical protein